MIFIWCTFFQISISVTYCLIIIIINMGTPYIFFIYIYMIKCGWLGTDLALLMWRYRCGITDVALHMWHYRCGATDVELPMWRRCDILFRCSITDVALSMGHYINAQLLNQANWVGCSISEFPLKKKSREPIKQRVQTAQRNNVARTNFITRRYRNNLL